MEWRNVACAHQKTCVDNPKWIAYKMFGCIKHLLIRTHISKSSLTILLWVLGFNISYRVMFCFLLFFVYPFFLYNARVLIDLKSGRWDTLLKSRNKISVCVCVGEGEGLCMCVFFTVHVLVCLCESSWCRVSVCLNYLCWYVSKRLSSHPGNGNGNGNWTGLTVHRLAGHLRIHWENGMWRNNFGLQ